MTYSEKQNDLPAILAIDTSTPICSVAILKGREVLALEEDHTSNSHSEKITLLIQKAMTGSDILKNDLKGVIVADGPGSYTGLRIGASAAKAYCFALEIPLMAEGNLLATAKESAHIRTTTKYHVSAIDARRDDVYALILDQNGTIVKDSALLTIDQSFGSYLDELDGKYCLSGNGAPKIIDLLQLDSRLDTGIRNSANNLLHAAMQLYDNQVFKNYLFYEPDYKQAPNITKSKKLLR